jgi:hypothetical protein
MTCGETMDAPVRKGETIVAYCIAQCKRHGESLGFSAATPAFAVFAPEWTKRLVLMGDRR